MRLPVLVLLVALVAGCVGSGDAMAVKKGDHVFVNYTGTLEDGTVFDSSEGRQPLNFTAGTGQMIKGFDAAVIGMKVGEEKTVTIKPEDAYGAYDPRNVVAVPRKNVPLNVKAGDTLNAGGQPVKVIEVQSDTVFIDVNHFLAGKTLIFRIKVVGIERK